MSSGRPSHQIAIVGMGCRFADAPDLHRFWEMTLAGRDGFGPVPENRWLHDAFFDANPRAKDKSYAPTGAFIQDVRSFPAVALGVPPRRVEVMDPQQRLALWVSLQAVEDAGRSAEQLPHKTGVYLGVTAVEYRTLQAGRILAQLMASGAMGDPVEDAEGLAAAVARLVPARAFTAPGLLANMVAATVAQELRLHGPAFTTDAACASSLVAISDAVNALRSGAVDAALAGGVYVCLTPEHHIAFSRIGAMSRQGRCLPFDDRADGFVQGDGCGVLVLKRLADAQRDGDRIYATIDGIAANNDGGGDGPMAPVQSGQVECIRAAWEDAGLATDALGYAEAHGTGTTVGDRIEFAGLVESLGGEAPVALGSCKANVGHTMSAAGVAGVIRAALAVHHKTLPPMAGFETPKPELPLEESRFFIPTTPQVWGADQRVATVSSFGFGGTNVHAVLQSAVAAETVAAEQAELVLMSAPDEASLRDLAARSADAIEADPKVTVAGVARAWAGRRRQPARLGVVAANRQELVERLREIGPGTAIGTAEEAPSIAFMYPGQGAQRTGMLRDIRRRFDVVRETLDQLSGLVEPTISDLLYPAVDDDAAAARLTATENCQPALLTVGVALTRLLSELGVRPTHVAGHSVGEFTAAVAAGVLTAEDGVRWTSARGRAMAALSGDCGAMVALVVDRETARGLLVDGAVIANLNHPKQTVVSGTTAAVDAVAARARAAGVKAVELAVSHGFHSPVLAALDLDSVVDALPLADPAVPLVSCIKDGAYVDAADAREVFKAHATSPVDFVRTLTHLDADLLLQVGAGGPLQGFARGAKRPALTLASTDDADGGCSLLLALARLWTRGVELDVTAITAQAAVVSVPPTVLATREYWAVRDEAIGQVRLSGATQAKTQAVVEAVEAPTSGGSVAETVMQAVARASAYPRNALREDMKLADDLGFDSMMLAELTADLTKVVPGLSGIPQELMINGPTIGQLIAFAESPELAEPDYDDDAPLGRYEPVWVAAPQDPGPARDGDVIVHIVDAPSVPVLAVLAGEVEAPDLAAPLIERLDRAAGLGQTPDVIVLCRWDDPWAEALAGVVRTTAREWPDAVCKCIRVQGPLVQSIADAERRSTDKSVDVLLKMGRRFVRGTRLLAEGVEPWQPAADEVVLVTGGTRGIGKRLADHLQTQGATVLRLGRAQADVTDLAALQNYLADKPPVTALVHAAGLLADGPLGSVSADRGRLARDVKWRGWLNAIVACGASLERALAIGSWAGRFGNRHQVHYAAANALVSGLAEHLPERLSVSVPEFGPWTSSEMVASIPTGVQAAMRSQGIDFVGDTAGLTALLEELSVGQGAVVRGRTVPASLRRVEQTRVLSVTTSPYLADHAIAGKPVLPLARAAGMLVEVVGRVAPFELRDLTLYQGVAVAEPVTLKLTVDGDTAELHNGDVLCYRAAVRPPAPSDDVIRREGGQAPTLTLDKFYAEHTFHGPLLQGITAIDGIGEDFIRGRVRVGTDGPIDMLALDSAMQLTAYVAATRFGRGGTPVGIERYVQHRPWPQGQVDAQAVFAPGESDRFSADIAFHAQTGELVATAEGVVAQLRKVEDKPEVKAEWTDPAAWPEYVALRQRMEQVAQLGVANPYFDLHQGTARDTTIIDGREIIHFSSYNYLGLSGDPRIRADVANAMERYGTSVSASRVASGERPFHRELEAGLAAALGVEDAIAFPSGHATNVTTIGHLFGDKDLILHDELIHDSCLQGIKLSGAARRGFRHDDPQHLESQLQQLRGHYEKVLVLIEGVYSMDGDIANLPEFLRIKERWGCLLMIDEAHSFGTVGKTGCGLREHFGIEGPRVDIWMGTMSKSLASMGGWIAGRRELIEYMRYTTPGFVFAAGMTPTIGQAALSALGLMKEEPWRVERLQHNCRFFYERLHERGINTGDAVGASPVMPVITGDSMQAMMLADRLLHAGINAKPIVFPAVAEDAARLRFFLTALHTEEQLTHSATEIANILSDIRRS